MATRTGIGTVLELDGSPWANARVLFKLLNDVSTGATLANPQCWQTKANRDGDLSVDLLVGGNYSIALPDGRGHQFTVVAGEGSFNLFDAVIQPPASEYLSFVRKAGDTLAGNLGFDGNAILNAVVGPTNKLQAPVLPAGQRPGDLEIGQVVYGFADGVYWVGTGADESFGADGSEIIPAPSAGKGWQEYPFVSAGGGGPVDSDRLVLEVINAGQQLEVGKEYWLTASSLATLPLPTTASARDRLMIRSFENTVWRITQAANQFIRFGNASTTQGETGRLDSIDESSSIELIYTGGDRWVVGHKQGNFEVV